MRTQLSVANIPAETAIAYKCEASLLDIGPVTTLGYATAPVPWGKSTASTCHLLKQGVFTPKNVSPIAGCGIRCRAYPQADRKLLSRATSTTKFSMSHHTPSWIITEWWFFIPMDSLDLDLRKSVTIPTHYFATLPESC